MASQGYFRYAGITNMLSASMTLGLGTNPSSISFSCPPQDSDIPKTGDATWEYSAVDSYSTDSFSRTFTECLCDKVTVKAKGTHVWNVTLLDRRWKWSFGEISGRYNNRVNGTVLPKNRKTLKELVELCLEAMGETDYDLTVVDEDEYPAVEWDLEVPSLALNDLIGEYGLTISLMADDSVKMVRLGFGAGLPSYNQLSHTNTFDPSNHPSRIRSVSRPTVFQADLPLKAVGFEEEFDQGELVAKNNALLDSGDTDQIAAGVEAFLYGPSSPRCTELKPIEELSYAPLAPSGYEVVNNRVQPVFDYEEGEERRTWMRLDPHSGEGGGNSLTSFEMWGLKDTDPFSYMIRQKKIQLYRQNIYKLYQIDISTLKADSNIRLPIDVEITSMEQILPLLNHNIGREGCHEDLRYKPAIVYGAFMRGRDLRNNEQPVLRYNRETGLPLRAYEEQGNAESQKNPLYPIERIYPGLFQPHQDETWNLHSGFSIEPEFGLVRFSQPMYLREKVGDWDADPNADVNFHKNIKTDRHPWEVAKFIMDRSKNPATRVLHRTGPLKGQPKYASFDRFVPAKIFLRCAIQVRREDTGSYVRGYHELTLDDNLGTEPKYLTREDVHMQYMRPFDSFEETLYDEAGNVEESSVLSDEKIKKRWKDNSAQVYKELKNYNAQALYNYLRYPSSQADYAGFVDLDTDGSIKNITYTISGGLATSSAARNCERPEFSLSIEEARIRSKTISLLNKDKKTKRQTGDAARNVRTNFMSDA